MPISSKLDVIAKSNTIVLDQLAKQGFDVDPHYAPMSELRAMVNYDMVITEEITDANASSYKQVHVKYLIDATARFIGGAINSISQDLFTSTLKPETDHILFIVNAKMSDNSVESLHTIANLMWAQHGWFIVIIPINMLQFNVLAHEKVPPHRIMSRGKIDKVNYKYCIKDSEYPSISRFDPVARAIGMRPGNICKIMRKSATAINAPYYRRCVATL